MAAWGPPVHPGTGLDEDVFDGGEFRYFSLRRRVAEQLVGHDPRWRFGTRRQYASMKTLGRRLVATLLQQNVKFGAALIDTPHSRYGSPTGVTDSSHQHRIVCDRDFHRAQLRVMPRSNGIPPM
jgi:hypothetical protein